MKNALFLRIFLGLAMFGTAAGIVYFIITRDFFLYQYPKFTPVLFWLYILSAAGIFAGAAGLWKWKSWGLYLFTAAFILAFSLEYYAGFPIEKIIRIPVMYLVMWLLLWKYRRRLN